MKGFRIASAELPSLAAVFLSSSPGDTARTLGRESKGEAFVTRSVMNTSLQAQPVARPRGCTVAEKVKHSGRRQHPDAGPGRTGTAARRAPPPAADRSDRGCQGPQAPRQGCARRPRAVPAGDEREGANLEQPDSGEAAGAPSHGLTHDPSRSSLIWIASGANGPPSLHPTTTGLTRHTRPAQARASRSTAAQSCGSTRQAAARTPLATENLKGQKNNELRASMCAKLHCCAPHSELELRHPDECSINSAHP